MTVDELGVALSATQAEQEAGTSVNTMVTPGRQQFHPSAAKGWVVGQFDGVVAASYNVTSLTDTGVGDLNVNWTTVFSGSTYCPIATAKTDNSMFSNVANTNTTAGVTRIRTFTSSTGALSDANNFYCAAFGDQ